MIKPHASVTDLSHDETKRAMVEDYNTESWYQKEYETTLYRQYTPAEDKGLWEKPESKK
jgi:hypothetical protein